MSRSENDPWYAFRDNQTARTYTQDELDAAVAAERERWQSMLLSAVAEAEIHARQQREFIVKVDNRGWWCEWRA